MQPAKNGIIKVVEGAEMISNRTATQPDLRENVEAIDDPS